MGIYLGGSYPFVPQHGLDGAQIGTALEQRGGKRVSKGVRTDGLLDACRLGLAFDHDENHGACEVCPSPIEKHIIAFTGTNDHQVAVDEPVFQFCNRLWRDGDEAFFAPLSQHADKFRRDRGRKVSDSPIRIRGVRN